MKKLLFVFLLLPLYSIAQLEAGFNAGITPFRVLNGSAAKSFKSPKTSIYDASVSYKVIRTLKLGLGYGSSNLLVVYNRSSINGTYAKPMSDLYAFADYRLSLTYFGINAGPVSIKNNNYAYPDAKGTGIAYGAHAGFNVRIYGGLYANMQAGVTYVSITFSPVYNPGIYETSARNSIITYPVTLGLHYRINFTKVKKTESH